MRRQVILLIVGLSLVASACGGSETQSAGIASSGSDANDSEPPAGGQVIPGLDNAELAEQLLLDQSDLEGQWFSTTQVDDNSTDAFVEASVQRLPECDATVDAFGVDILTSDVLGGAPVLTESPVYESPIGDSVEMNVEVYLDPREPAEYFRLFDEANLEACLTLVSEELFVDILSDDPALTVLPLKSQPVQAPAGNDDVFAVELIAPVDVSGGADFEARVAFLLVRRGGVVLSTTVSHGGDVNVEAVLVAMHDRLDEVLGQ